MKISLSWLQEYLPGKYDVDHLADSLTMAGLEVDAIIDRYTYLDTVLVGRIETVGPHPKADHLKCCQVNTGENNIRVVCGAPNTVEGMLAPIAIPGTVLPDGTKLTKTVIRGEPSEGMLCSEAELGLGTDTAGLMMLDSTHAPGQSLRQALTLIDPVFDIDLTPNRADCNSILGICREVAAIEHSTVQYPDVPIPQFGGPIDRLASVAIETPDLCPRYSARIVADINVKPSPFWLQDRLRSVGLRPINNVVDITNFVMMETAQPLHAFDFDHLAGHRIIVKTADKGDQFTTLDGQSRKLEDDTLMICDGEKPVAVAGVMGGLNSEIEDTTTRVLIESACFNPASIRRTAKRFNLTSDASYRFERGVDPEGTVRAMERAAHLMVDLCEGTLIEGIIDAHPRPVKRQSITLSANHTNRVLGTDLKPEQIKQLFESIEFDVQMTEPEKDMAVLPPSYRVDISRPEDLMEEVARLHGYNRIPTTFPAITDSDAVTAPELNFRQRIKTLMTGFGFMEAIVYSFGDEKTYDHLGLADDDPRRRFVALLNPLTESQSIMRSSLVPGILSTVQYNISRQIRHIKLFEIGRTFIEITKDNLPEEKEVIAGLWTGHRDRNTWHNPSENCDFYDIKGVVESLLSTLRIEKVQFTRLSGQDRSSQDKSGHDNLDRFPYYKVGHTATINCDQTPVGVVGEISPDVLSAFDIVQPVFMFELDSASLLKLAPTTRLAQRLPRYPAITRDMTIIVDTKIEGLLLKSHLMRLNEPLIESIELIDVFEGRPIPDGKKSLSFRVTYRSEKETLVDDMINDIHQQITHSLIKAFDAALPT